MQRDMKFWVWLGAFEVAFGFAVFAATRAYYAAEPAEPMADSVVVRDSAPVWSDSFAAGGLPVVPPPASGLSLSSDPVEMSRQADEAFGNRQYERAAELYQRLLALDPSNVELHNNLGLTLHYVGRSDEALTWLEQGIAKDPTHQRIWLTLGFVSAQTGNVERARDALQSAVRMDPASPVGQSAQRMLGDLP
ncbi:MAG: tetratricopeptide repeat protein [Gammaproteobacteria bacterium]|nr:tetratricopeptide repeat protein [Gammaproteobacteria bacterium]MDH4255925.1 tetratricopeptide repeat protein [Gammaproteobacteria bacterium]MDH5311272.1 tetratricopeptide repeat protein [Gammaproteobacteria bacterium]